MSKHHLRSDKTCQNCGHEVPASFCSYCGQENVESRQSFGHLAGHFFEDLTHYEGRFWKTILYLIGRPAYLSKAYLAGKRNSFVPPVRLYFFISFVTFLLPHFLPEGKSETQQVQAHQVTDSSAIFESNGNTLTFERGRRVYSSVHEMDSVELTLPKAKRMDAVTRWMQTKNIAASHYTKEEKHEKLAAALLGNFPKALFIYLPLFALVLWIFHGKKRWMYFDHAIFVIHYFCFMMLVISIINLLKVPIDLWGGVFIRGIFIYVWVGVVAWFIYYFFRAHRKMYNESWAVSALKGTITFVINAVIFFFILLGLIIFAISTLH